MFRGRADVEETRTKKTKANQWMNDWMINEKSILNRKGIKDDKQMIFSDFAVEFWLVPFVTTQKLNCFWCTFLLFAEAGFFSRNKHCFRASNRLLPQLIVMGYFAFQKKMAWQQWLFQIINKTHRFGNCCSTWILDLNNSKIESYLYNAFFLLPINE